MNQRYAQRLWAIVLAGERDLPSQDFRALERVEQLIPSKRILVVTSRAHQDQLAHWPDDNVIVQTADHGTAPSILLALAYLAHRQPFATVAIFPERSVILDGARFISAVQQAVEETYRFPRKLTLLGLTPDHETDGYVADAATVWEMVRQTAPELHQDFMYIRRALGKAHAEWVIENVYGMLTPTNFFAEVCTPLKSRLRVLDIPEDSQEEGEKRKGLFAALRHHGATDKRASQGQHTREGSGVALL